MMRRQVLWFGERVTVSPMVLLISVGVIATMATGITPRPVLYVLLGLQVFVILLGVRIHRPRPTGKRS